MYVLDGKTPVRCESLEGRSDADFFVQIAFTEVGVGPEWISTIFVGIDLSHGRSDKPVVFETLTSDGAQDRYTSWEEAEAVHSRHVKRLRANQ